MTKKSVVVLLGGWSAEREVSLVSGAAVVKALAEAGYEVRTHDMTHDLGALMRALEPRPDAVFNALHGRYGEDGRIQGILDILGVPYTHSGMLASAMAMNKPLAKRLFEDAGIPCPPGLVIRASEAFKAHPMEPPYVMKPLEEGSSVGVVIVQKGDNLAPMDWPYGDEIMVERFIPGREITVAVMGDRPLAVTELRPHGGFYDYEAKYTDGKTEHLIPAPLPKDAYDEAMDIALRAHQALGCRGVSRSDLRYDDTEGGRGRFYLLEVNTQPGMTPLSLVPEQAAHVGISFPELCRWMVENARCEA
ncbi:MAG: D-alanine--D-alanine ligase [Alphaproteobacteria bacterium]|nr:D-alanine--D-alanine ligase [Alphaproteobacteria bacterium]